MAPAFTLPDTSGHNVSLAEFKGKYVLIDFWATWCGPCMAEMPNVRKAYEKYKASGFEIIGVSLDRPDSKEKWKKVIVRDHLAWTHVSDLNWWNSKAALAYNINSVPANFLIDPNGKIIGKNLRGEALQDKLTGIFHNGAFNLDGRILSDSTLKGAVYLQYEDEGGYGRDSCALVNNTYHFSGKMKDGAIKANLFWKQPGDGKHFSGFAQFYMAPGNTLVIHQARFNTFDSPGSTVQQENQRLNNLLAKHNDTYADSAKIFVRQHPDSWISYVALENMIRSRNIDQDTAAALYQKLSSRLKSYDQLRQLEARITGMMATTAGKPAIDFIESDTTGKPVSLSSFRGKYVLIKFWASWCHPCRAENKVLSPIYHKYKDKGFEVLGVSLDNAVGKPAWIKAIKDDGTDWTQICDFKGSLNDAAVKYGVMVVPTSFLIDPKGNIIAKNLMGEALDKKLAYLLN
jgi:peroxiredoxin